MSLCGIAAYALARAASADGVAAFPPVETAPAPPAPAPPAPAPPVPEAPSGQVAPEATNLPAPASKGPRVHWASSERAASQTNSEAEAAESEPGAHLHDGLYYRVAFGAGHFRASSENGSKVSGWGFSPEFWMGGSPIVGLALGGTVGILLVPNPDATITAADSGGSGDVSGEARGIVTYSTIGVFADYYPMPRAGLHIMTGLHLSSFKFTADSGQESQPASGLGVFGGVGYEWWAGEQWSVGPLVRLHWSSVSDDGGTTSILSPVFMLGVTNH